MKPPELGPTSPHFRGAQSGLLALAFRYRCELPSCCERVRSGGCPSSAFWVAMRVFSKLISIAAVSMLVSVSLVAAGVTPGSASVAVAAAVVTPRTVVPAAAAAAVQSWGTITGTVSFATAPAWDTQSGDRSFIVRMIDHNGLVVDTSLLPVYYSYVGANGFSISYPNNADFYYTDYRYMVANGFTVAIYPSDPVYPTTYLGGTTSIGSVTYQPLPLQGTPSQTAEGNIGVALSANISGTLTVPGGLPAGGVQAIAVSTTADFYKPRFVKVNVNADGSYHLFGLAAGSYNVAFVPTGGTAGPGAGVWWNSKASLTGASVVTLLASQQRAGVNQALPAGGVITGVLKDSQGHLIHGGGGVAIYSTAGTADSRSTLVQQTWVAADGSFQFWGLPVGSYKLGFNTGVLPPVASALEVRNINGSALPARPLPTVVVGGYAATSPDGSLATSTYPYTSAWYTASAVSFTAARSVAITASGQIVANINGVLPIVASFSGWQTAERTTGQNPSEKRASCPCGDPVDTFSGEFSDSTVDLALPGAGLRVQLDRSYAASLAAADGPFGWGSSSSLSAKLVEVPGSGINLLGGVVVTQENGATVAFTKSPQGDYFAPARVNATLTYDYYLQQWVFTRNATDVFVFSHAGAVLSHRDLHGNTVDYATDASGLITSIAGSGGRSIALTWAGGHITSATDSAGRVVSYGYDAQGELTSVSAVDGRVVGFGYDAAHLVTSETRPGGGVLTNVYDAQSRVTTQTDPLGRVTAFAYSGTDADSTTTVTNPAGIASTFHFLNGALASRTEAAGTASAATTSYTFDAALDIVKQTDPLGKSTTMSYDTAGNMLTSTDPLGHSTSYSYDGLHDVTGVTDPLGRVSTAVYDASGQKTSATTPSGATSSWQFNTDGTVAASTNPLGATTSYGYDSTGRLTSTTDPLGRVGQIGFDAAGHPVSTTDPSGATATHTVDAAGRTLSSTDPLGRVTSYSYDAAGYRTTGTAADGSVTSTAYDLDNEPVSQTDALNHTSTVSYTALGQVATTTNADGAVTTTGYDPLGHPTSVTDPKNLKTTTSYDKDGRVTQIRTPAGHLSKVSYDAAGRKISSTDPLGNVSTYSYDVANQLVGVTDPLGRVSHTNYDADGRPTTATGPDGHVNTTSYDAAGRKIGYTDADGNASSFSYDSVGELTGRTAPGGLVTGYRYDTAGRVALLTKPDGTTITNSYDPAGELLASTPSVGTGMSLTYDALGRRSKMTDVTGATSYEYSLTGQPTKVTNGAGSSVGYSYDPAGLNTQLTYPGGKKVSYVFDLDGRMTSLTDWANHNITFAWTADSLLAKQTDPNKVTATTVYDTNDRISSITVASTATPASTLASDQYGYDAASQLTSTTIADPLHTATGGTATNYGYDQRGQLTASGATGSYSTTPAGQLTATPSGDALSYNPAQQLTASVNVPAGATSTYQYDGNGNRTQSASITGTGAAPATTLGYDFQNELASVSSGATAVSYTSDGDGLRQSRASGAVTSQFVWDTSTSIPLLLDDGTSRYIYGPALTPVAQVDASGAIQYLHADNIGSVRLITNSTGLLVGANDYSPYGAVTVHTGTASSNFGYATAWSDPDTNIDYLRARDYDPVTGQFLQVDPAVDSTHEPYAYVAGDPLALTDPTGLCIGMNGTTQDRKCGYNDFFWAGLGPSIGQALVASSQGFNDGLLFGVPLLANNDYCRLGIDPSFWSGYIGGTLIAAGTLGLAAAERAETQPLGGASSGIIANKAAGDAARDEIMAENPGSMPEQTFETGLGSRRVDVLTPGKAAIESKVGRTSLGSTEELQIAKDRQLIEQGKVTSVQWAFTRSGVTGKIGPTGPLAKALTEAGIGWVER